MKQCKLKLGLMLLGMILAGCSQPAKDKSVEAVEVASDRLLDHPAVIKPVIYQVFPRIFGNRNTTNKPWGTTEENGVGKFADFTPEALQAIRRYGTTHIWYTGVLHHALVGDYTEIGISNDDPDVVKGRAGSPYAVKDYYNVDPDLASNPEKRLAEFKALVERTHQQGMKVIIDIVPNHVARNYQSISRPHGVTDFGVNDNIQLEYARDNNFYYIVGEDFKVPEPLEGYQPLGGEAHSQIDQAFSESPAKWTGNGSRKAQPHFYDWYETVKVNYGVKPDGSLDFSRIPSTLRGQGYEQHFAFWQDQSVPDSWIKFREIAEYWIAFGVDGFRYDMAEMVPVEFWSYLNSAIKMKNAEAFLLAEVYNPALYRDYLQLGLMDSLYDKVDLYDTLKLVIQEKALPSKITPIIQQFADIDKQMLHFLENHDEQRIASTAFAGDPRKAMPAMTVSALAGQGPTLLYYAQALGEEARQAAGFGGPTRTTIFDYWGLDKLKRWSGHGDYQGTELTPEEVLLQQFYQQLLTFSRSSAAMQGDFISLHEYNLRQSKNYNKRLYAFARDAQEEKIIVVSNFSDHQVNDVELLLPPELAATWQFDKSKFTLSHLFVEKDSIGEFRNGAWQLKLDLNPYESAVLILN